MDFSPRLIEYDTSLDDEGLVKIYVRIRTRIGIVEYFSIVLVSYIGNEPHEIIRMDGDSDERVHIHHHYLRPPLKKYYPKPLTGKTIDEYVIQIKTNWQWYLSQYRENYI